MVVVMENLVCTSNSTELELLEKYSLLPMLQELLGGLLQESSRQSSTRLSLEL